MKIIDLSVQRIAGGKASPIQWLADLFSEGKGRQADQDAQDEVMARTQNALGDDFTLIRDITLPGLGTRIPMALVGPPGIFVLYASAIKGTFRARGNAWLKLDSSGNMRNSKPNLPHLTRLYAEAIRKFLAQNGMPNAEIEAVLLFSQPEAFVENIKAPIRMVMCDGMESYSASLRLLNPIYSPDECSTVVRLISNPEGKLSITEEIAAAEAEIVPQMVVMPSTEVPAEEPVQEADFLPEDVVRGAFTGERQEPASIPIPPVIEEAVELAPGASPISAFLARTHMNASQITILGVFALMDLLVICVGFAIVAINLLR
jgi:hypothetical protein